MRDVLYNSIWNVITYYYFIMHAGARAYPNAYFGQGTGALLLDRLSCTGSEQALLNCSHSGIGVTTYYCGHDDDAGVGCLGWLSLMCECVS